MLEIRTTGIEDYMPGGEANIKTLVVGGPGVGKTRWASFWPRPIYADCEAGRASIADRGTPYVEVRSSEDMLQWLKLLQAECRRPKGERRFETAVVDTLDSFQRKCKDEYLQAHPTMASFSGYDAWGWLDAKMQMLMTRLLNLDMNVVVLVHYKDKTRTEGSGDAKVEVVERMLQLQGDIKDSAFNDFDLVGRMDTYWASDGEQRVQKRGLTFQTAPDWPFLKDRLHVTPEWLEVRFDESDYTRLFEAFLSRVDDLAEGTVLDRVDDIPDEHPIEGTGAVGHLAGGPVPPQDPKDMPLDQLKKPELLQMARGYDSIKDQVKTNMLKAELIELIEKARAEDAPGARVDDYEAPAEDMPTETPVEPAAGNGQVPPADGEVADEEKAEQASTPVEAPAEPRTKQMPDGSGSVTYPAEGAQRVMTPEEIAAELDATVEDDQPADEGTPAVLEQPAEAKPEAKPEAACEVCGKDISEGSGENRDYVKLAWIKFRRKLCNEHYQEAKKNQ